MILPQKIKVREVGPREGFQIIKHPVDTAIKIELIELLSKTGLKEIEVTSFVRPDLMPQMADAAEVVAKLNPRPDLKYTALYLNQKGFELAEQSGKLSNSGWISAACSSTFLARNANTSIDKIISGLPDWKKAFDNAGKRLHGLTLSTAFGCAYEGPIGASEVVSVIGRLTSAATSLGMDFQEICLADTVGMGNPKLVQETVMAVREKFPALYISLHLHDTRGCGLANALAGLEIGIDCFDSSIGGIGGCPFSPGAAGNISTEDFVYLCQSMGIDTGIDLPLLIGAARFLRDKAGIEIFSKCPTALGNIS